MGFFIASTIGMVVSLCLSIYFIRADLAWEFDQQRLREILRYSIHLVSAMVLFELANLLDRYILVTFGGLNDVGVYSFGARIANITQLVVSGFSMAWFPLAMNIAKNTNAKDIYSRVNAFYVLLGAFFVAALVLFRIELLSFFAPDYLEAVEVIGILTLFNYVAGSVYVFTLGLHVTGKTKAITKAAIASVCVNAGSSIALYSVMGIEGVAVGTLLGGLVWIGVQYRESQKHYQISFDTLSFITAFFTLVAAFILFEALEYMEIHWVVSLSIRIIYLLAVLLLVLYRLSGSLSVVKGIVLGGARKVE
jgi:O-antigen/teichoic acid export membrane protein